MLLKTFIECRPESEGLELNFNQALMSRQSLIHVNKTNRSSVGLSSLCRRFHYIDELILLEWLNKKLIAIISRQWVDELP
jgi:hypothetical protein